MYIKPADYLTRLEEILIAIERKNFPDACQNSKKCFGYISMPFACMPCLLWSTVWRIVACPYMCMCKGAAFCCSDNGCTMITDSAIGAYVSQFSKIKSLPQPPVSGWSQQELERLKELLSQVDAMFIKKPYTPHHYQIAQVCFGCLPFEVSQTIKEINDRTSAFFSASMTRKPSI